MLLLLLSAAAPVAAQFDTATVVGTVKDASGATVPDAKVTLTNTETGVSVVRTTTNDGTYELVPSGPASTSCRPRRAASRFALVDNVQVQVAARLRVEPVDVDRPALREGRVTAASPLVETETSQRGQVIGGEQMRGLALNGRSTRRSRCSRRASVNRR